MVHRHFYSVPPSLGYKHSGWKSGNNFGTRSVGQLNSFFFFTTQRVSTKYVDVCTLCHVYWVSPYISYCKNRKFVVKGLTLCFTSGIMLLLIHRTKCNYKAAEQLSENSLGAYIILVPRLYWISIDIFKEMYSILEIYFQYDVVE